MNLIKNRNIKGVCILVFALLMCVVFLSRYDNDKYSVVFFESDFRAEYIEDYSGSATEHHDYISAKESAVELLIKGPLSLQPSTYNVELQYHAQDDSTVFKIYATDYVSSDNSGGRVLYSENLDKNDGMIKASIELDQTVDSVFISVETKDESFLLGRVNLSSVAPIYNDRFLYCAATILIAIAFFLMINSKEGKNPHTSILSKKVTKEKMSLAMLIVMGITVFIASLPLFSDVIQSGHDLPFHLARITGIERALESGQFPVRVHGGTLNDYGYPNSLFYPELLLYIPAILSIFDVHVVTSYNFYIIIVNALSVFIAYISFKKLFKMRDIALFLAIAYTLNPYRLICAYYRSAIGEFTAITFLPLVLYGLYAIILNDKRDWLYLVVGATGVLQSHFLTTEITALFAAVAVIFSFKHLLVEKRWLYLLLAAVVCIALNAWMLGPMVLMMLQLGLIVFTRVQSPYGFANYDVMRLFSTGSLFSIGPHPVGWLCILGLGFYLLTRTVLKSDENVKIIKTGDMLSWVGLISVVATTAFFPWEMVENIPILGEAIGAIQFPYRMLSIAEISLVCVLGISVYLWGLKEVYRNIVCISLAVIAVILTFSFYNDVFVQDGHPSIQNKHYYANNLDNSLSVGQAEYLIEGANLDDIVREPPIITSDNESLQITDMTRFGTVTEFNYTMDLGQDKENIISLPYSYIPTYEITVNGEKMIPIKHTGGKVAFAALSDVGEVVVRYVEPLTFRVFELISLFTLITLIVLIKGRPKFLLDIKGKVGLK